MNVSTGSHTDNNSSNKKSLPLLLMGRKMWNYSPLAFFQPRNSSVFASVFISFHGKPTTKEFRTNTRASLRSIFFRHTRLCLRCLSFILRSTRALNISFLYLLSFSFCLSRSAILHFHSDSQFSSSWIPLRLESSVPCPKVLHMCVGWWQ